MAKLSEFETAVAGNVRAEAGRANVSYEQLALATGLGKSAIYSRFNEDVAWKLSEIQKIAMFLGISISTLTYFDESPLIAAA